MKIDKLFQLLDETTSNPWLNSVKNIASNLMIEILGSVDYKLYYKAEPFTDFNVPYKYVEKILGKPTSQNTISGVVKLAEWHLKIKIKKSQRVEYAALYYYDITDNAEWKVSSKNSLIPSILREYIKNKLNKIWNTPVTTKPKVDID